MANIDTASTARSSGSGLPLVFIGSSIFAYLSLKAVEDTATRIVASLGIGIVTSIGSSLFAIAGALVIGGVVALGAWALTRDGAATAISGTIGLIVGAIGGGIFGIAPSYTFGKNAIMGLVEPAADQSVIERPVQETRLQTVPRTLRLAA